MADLTDIPIIDAHHHFWDIGRNYHPWLCDDEPVPFRYGDYTPIRRNYLVPEYKADATGHNVVKNIHMEAEWVLSDQVGETKWLHELHDATGYPHALVGHVLFEREDAAEVLAGHAAYPLSRSVRQKPAQAASPVEVTPGAPGSMGDPKFREGYANLAKHGLHYDLQTPSWHLAEAAELARDFPDTLIILNHCGMPADRSEAGLTGWRAGMEQFADQPNTMVKISGIGVAGQGWSLELNGGIIRDCIRIFGADRAMFASNFPVDGICASFDTIYSGFKEVASELPEADARALFYDTANRVYRPV